MLRFAICLTLLTTPLAAQDSTAHCAASGEIIDAAVVARTDGKGKRATSRAITRSLTGDKAGFKPAVVPLVDWVFTLPQDQLNDEAGAAFVTACLAQ